MPQAKTDAIGWMTAALATFLKANVPGLKKAIVGWPNPNEKIDYPSITIFVKAPKFTPLMPVVIQRGAIGADSKATVAKIRGMYDFELQLDLFCRYRPERSEYTDAVVRAFMTNPEFSGINLVLADYYNETVSLALTSLEYMDDGEQEVQRNEWRTKIRVVGNMRIVQEETSAIITKIENNLETPKTIPADPEPGFEPII